MYLSIPALATQFLNVHTLQPMLVETWIHVSRHSQYLILFHLWFFIEKCLESLDAEVECDLDNLIENCDEWNNSNIINLLECAHDDCSMVSVTSDYDIANLADSCGNTGSLLVTYTISDNCGNAITMTGVYEIVDNTPPMMTECDPYDLNATVDCDSENIAANCAAWNAANMALLDTCYTDACDDDVDVTSDYDGVLSDSCGLTGSLVVTYTITDDCGNATEVTAVYTVIDTTAPDLSACAPLDATVECDAATLVENCDAWNTAKHCGIGSLCY